MRRSASPVRSQRVETTLVLCILHTLMELQGSEGLFKVLVCHSDSPQRIRGDLHRGQADVGQAEC